MEGTMTLSENAVAVLRLQLKGYSPPPNGLTLDALRELSRIGIMEPVPNSQTAFRLTPDGLAHGQAILERESERIERSRHIIPDDLVLSQAARDLLRTCVLDQPPEGDPSNRPSFRELVAAGIMMPVGTFTKGDECVFRFTLSGWRRRYELAGLEPVPTITPDQVHPVHSLAHGGSVSPLR